MVGYFLDSRRIYSNIHNKILVLLGSRIKGDFKIFLYFAPFFKYFSNMYFFHAEKYVKS